MKYEVPWIGGVQRRAEPSDKPPFLPNDLQDMIMQEDGKWSVRPGCEEEYPDRGNNYEWTTPLALRGISHCNSVDWGGRIDGIEQLYYTSHRRKVIALGENAGIRYIFLGVVFSFQGGGEEESPHRDGLNEFQKLYIFRGLIDDETGLITWQGHASSAIFGRIEHKFMDDRNYIEFSMVMNDNKDALIIAINLHDEDERFHSVLNVVKLTDLYTDNWGIDADEDYDSEEPLWTIVGNAAVENLAGNDYLTHDIDIDYFSLADVEVLQLVYSVCNTMALPPQWLRHRTMIGLGEDASWTAADDFQIADKSIYGILIKRRPASSLFDVSYLVVAADATALIYNQTVTGASNLLAADAASIGVNINFSAEFLPQVWSYLGHSMGHANDGTRVYCYRNESPETLYVKVGSADPIKLPYSTDVRGEYPSPWAIFLYTGFDLIVRDGYLNVYFVTNNKGLTDNSWQLWRSALIFDEGDSDYVNGTFFERELVEDYRTEISHADHGLACHRFVCGYYGLAVTDPEKFVAFIRFDSWIEPFGIYAGCTANNSEICCARQDRGLVGGVKDISPKSLIRYPAEGDGVVDRITVVQCDDNRFYWRRLAGEGDWHWRLLKGQMADDNSDIVQETIVDGRAFFWRLGNNLRAGVGTMVGCFPIVYQYIKKYIYRNERSLNQETPEQFYMNERRFHRTDILHPVMAINHNSGSVAEINVFQNPEENAVGRAAFGYLTIDGVNAALISAYRVGVWGNETSVSVQRDGDRMQIVVVYHDRVVESGWHSNIVRLQYALTLMEPRLIIMYLIAGAGTTLDVQEITLEGGIDGTSENNDFYIGVGNNLFPAAQLDAVGNLTGYYPEARLSHPFKVLNLASDTDNIPQPYWDVFIGIAQRYDDGQISQIAMQTLDEPYKIGFEVEELSALPAQHAVFTGYAYRYLVVSLLLRRWTATVEPGDPRISSLLIFMAKQETAGQDKFDAMEANGRLLKEVLVSKAEVFKDAPEDGDSEWDVVNNDIVQLTTICNYRNFQMTWEVVEQAQQYIGHSLPVYRSDTLRPVIQGYKYAEVVNDRPFYLNLLINGLLYEDMLMWSGEAVNGGSSFITPDVTGVEYAKRFRFKGMGLYVLGDKLVVCGDTDIEWGSVSAETLAWQFIETYIDKGVIAPRSINKLAESLESGRLSGMIFLNQLTGLHAFNLYEAPPITDDILNDYIQRTNPSGTLIESTLKGMKGLIDEYAMALHLPDYHLLLIHFPTDGLTWVRDFAAEANAAAMGRGGGMIWMMWNLTPSPTAWTMTPEGSLLYIDDNLFYRYPRADNDNRDVLTAISPLGRLGDMKISSDSFIIPVRIIAEYKLHKRSGADSDPSLVLTVHKDDGNRPDVGLEFPYSDVRTRKTISFGIPKGRAKERISISWKLTNADCADAFDLYDLECDLDQEQLWG